MRNLNFLLCAAGLLTITFAGLSVAQMPTDAQIQKQMETVRKETKSLAESTGGKAPAPSSPPIKLPAMPPAVPQSERAAGVDDLSKLALRFQSGSLPVAGQDQTSLLVFVSLSMPKAVLVELARQASVANATLVLRGFTSAGPVAGATAGKEAVAKANINSTQQRIESTLSGVQSAQAANWVIDPNLFSGLKVKSVPAFFIGRLPAAECSGQAAAAKQCDLSWRGAMVYGDQSISTAMQRVVSRSSSKETKALAQSVIKTIEGGK